MAGVRLVHSADLHLGSAVNGFDPRCAELIRSGVRRAFGEIIDCCIKTEADVLLLSGDIFDLPVPAAADAEFFCRELERLDGTRAFVALGNHDYAAAAAISGAKAHIFSTKPEKVYIPQLNLNVYGQSFSGRYQPESLLSGFEAEPERINILCMHANLRGSDCNPVSPAQLEKSGLAYAALGHIHGFSCERFGSTYACFSGCPAGRGFDETGEKGFAVGQCSELGAEVSFVPSSAPRFEEIKLFAADYSTNDAMFSEIEGRLKPENLYRVTIAGAELPAGYAAARLSGKALFVEVNEEASGADSLFISILRSELKDNPRALSIAVKALTGRGDEI